MSDPSQPESASPNGERIFLCTEGEASKFWRVRVEGAVQTVRYGRIGTEGHELTKTFEGAEVASKATQKLIAEKLGKGYREVSDEEATAAHDAVRAMMGASAVPSPGAPRRARTAGKPKPASWQQLLLSFDDDDGGAEAGVGLPILPEPKSQGASALAFEF